MTIETREIAVGEFTFTTDLAGPADGAPVLLLHGFPETRHMWRRQVAALGDAGFRAMAPDQRGYSRGARPTDVTDYATDRLIADAAGIMATLGYERWHQVGHDWGGQLSWLIAAAYPEKVLSLNVLSRPHPAAFARAMRDDTQQASRSGHHRAFREDDAVVRMRAAELKPLRDALARQGVPAADVDVYCKQLMQPGAIEGAMNWYRATGLNAVDVPPVSVRTLYVWGTQDATVGRRAAELTAEYVAARYRFVEIEGAGHFSVDQFPDRVSALLLDHIKDGA
ncbi:MAG: alpha/beta hydrolase [Alphaproteobacteria bacterium]|nr:alpha/beta hydrolase [Alphaproteobacteria bacterium]MBL6937840.1 alpha/beta hydrolase [Alphaproteobacteria bacterium]MBL7099334.1 alpha/beta hydrolase [Alphaproteobacteria bacterium]